MRGRLERIVRPQSALYSPELAIQDLNPSQSCQTSSKLRSRYPRFSSVASFAERGSMMHTQLFRASITSCSVKSLPFCFSMLRRSMQRAGIGVATNSSGSRAESCTVDSLGPNAQDQKRAEASELAVPCAPVFCILMLGLIAHYRCSSILSLNCLFKLL